MTPEQRKNLITLANYLDALPPDYTHFHMGMFARVNPDDLDGNYKDVNIVSRLNPADNGIGYQCGAVACALGHGVAAGIPALPGETWPTYAKRAYGVSQWPRLGESDAAWEWMFSGNWDDIDNSPSGAAARIRYFLANGPYPDTIQILIEQELFDYDELIKPYMKP